MNKYNLRIPENLQIIVDTQESNTGVIVKFNPGLWGIFRRKAENMDEYGYQLMDPNSDQRGEHIWRLTHNQCVRLINNLIKNPGYGFGKTQQGLQEHINKLIINIKQT